MFFWIFWWDVFNLGLIALIMLGYIGYRVVCASDRGDVRRQKDDIQTAIVTYEHPATRRRVVCVGMMHIGEAEYYQNIQKYVDDLAAQGYTVLYEFVGHPSPDAAPFTEAEEITSQNLAQMARSTARIGTGYGIVYQGSGIEYRPQWHRTDMNWDELIRPVTKANTVFSRKSLTPFMAMLEAAGRAPGSEAWMPMVVSRIFSTSAFSAAGLFGRRGESKRLMQVIDDQRTVIALQAIRDYLAQGNVVTMWGAGHLRGIGHGLEADGFIPIGRTWERVYRIQRFGFWRSIYLTIKAYFSLLDNLSNA